MATNTDIKATEARLNDYSAPPEKHVPHSEYVPAEYINGKPYWRTSLFVGSFWAIGFGVLACYAGFAMPANTLALINADIGIQIKFSVED